MAITLNGKRLSDTETQVEIDRLNAALKAAQETQTASPARFKLRNAAYSMTHPKTLPALRGKLKGSVTIFSTASPFGLDLFRSQWEDLKEHAEAITSYFVEHQAELDAAQKVAVEIKTKPTA
jgi:hypothetical protein